MATSDPKQIKLQLVVDKASFDRLNEVIRQVTREVTQLVEMLNRLGTGVGGIGGRGGMVTAGAKATSTTGSSGGTGGLSGLTAMTSAVSTRSVGTSNDITKTLVENKNLLKAVSSGSREVMKDMADSVRDSIRAQTAEIDKLRNSLKKLNQEYKETQADLKAGKAGPTAEGLAAIDRDRAQVTHDLLRGEGNLADSQKALAELGGGAPGAARKYGFGQRFFATQAGRIGGLLAGPEGAQATQSFFMDGAGAGAAKLLGPAGIALAVGMAAQKFVGTQIQSSVQANQDWWATKRWIPEQNKAAIGGTFGGLGASIRWGSDFSTVRSTQNVLHSKGFRDLLTDDERRRLMIQEQHLDTGQAIGLGEYGTAWSNLKEDMGRSLTGGDKTQRGIARDTATMQIIQAHAADFDKMVQMDKQKNALRTALYDATWQEAPGFTGAARMLGISEGEKRSGAYWRDDMSEAEKAARIAAGQKLRDLGMGDVYAGKWAPSALDKADLMLGKMGYTTAEGGAMAQSIARAAGRGYMGHYGGLLGMQTGGLSNVANIFGVGAQFDAGFKGKGNPALLRAIQGSIGRGGIDVTAGDILSQTVGGAMTAGNWTSDMGGGVDFARGLFSAASGGSAGGDMRGARIMQAGMGAYGNILSGGADRLQQGINVLSGVQAMGDLGRYARYDVQSLGPAEMTQILRSGKVPDYLARQGITIDHIRKYASAQTKFGFSRNIGAEESPEMQARLQAVRAAGGTNAYLRQVVSGKKGKARTDALSSAVEDLATLRRHGLGGTREENVGAIRSEAMADKELYGDLKGKGAHDPSDPNSTARRVIAAQAQARYDKAGMRTDEKENLDKTAAAKLDAAKSLQAMTQVVMANEAKFSESLARLTAAIDNAVNDLDGTRASHIGPPKGK